MNNISWLSCMNNDLMKGSFYLSDHDDIKSYPCMAGCVSVIQGRN